jgi:hypothetical protein
MRNHRGFLAAPVIAALVALLGATGATASPPQRVADFSTSFWPAGTVCAYPVTVKPVANKSLLHILANGDLLITGRLVDRVTNQRTGASRTYVVNGPLRVVSHDDGSATLYSHGSILWTLLQEDAGGPGLFIFTGRVVMQVSPQNALISTTRPPGVEDVCAELG